VGVALYWIPISLYLLNGDQTIAEFLDQKSGFISIITELELIGYPDSNEAELQQVKSFISTCTVIDINDDIRSSYTDLRSVIN
jgi:hypothetical protein